MRNKEEIKNSVAQILAQLRKSKGLSKSQMAGRLFVDAHTWARYESGESSPSVSDFIWIFEQMGADALRPVLDVVYPDTYAGLNPEYSADELRKALVHYSANVASDRHVRVWNYLAFGQHGSNIEPQMQEFLMIDHLPMIYRYAIAETIYTFWRLAEAKGELINTDCIMPDIDIFLSALNKGRDAAIQGSNSYTTLIEK